jgi:hypothetical protein
MSLFMPTQLISNHLDKVYQVTQRDIGQLASAKSLAEQAKKHSDNLDEQIDWLIKTEGRKAGVSGFISGFSGVSLSVVTLPANFASVTYLQMRLAAAIAHLKGVDLDDKATCDSLCNLVAGTSVDVPRGGAVQAGKLITSRLLGAVPKKALKKVNDKAGKKVLQKGKAEAKGENALDATSSAASDSAAELSLKKPAKKTRAQKKADKKEAKVQAKADKKQAKQEQKTGLLDITRLVPLVGGAVGAVLDAKSTQKVGAKVRNKLADAPRGWAVPVEQN